MSDYDEAWKELADDRDKWRARAETAEAALAAAREDAERYRWWRENGGVYDTPQFEALDAEVDQRMLDDAIDAARTQGKA
jgi:hypothetical protein